MWYVSVGEIQVASYYTRFDAFAWVVAMLQASRDRYGCGSAGTGPCGVGTCAPRGSTTDRCRSWHEYTAKIERAYTAADAGGSWSVALAGTFGTAVTIDQYPTTGVGNVALLRDWSNGDGHLVDAGVSILDVATHFDTHRGDARPLISLTVRFLNGHPQVNVDADTVIEVPIGKVKSVRR